MARNYATLAADGRTANLKLTPEEQEFKVLLAPEGFRPVDNAWGRQGWTTLELDQLSVAELQAALEWRHASPVGCGASASTRAAAGCSGPRTAVL